MRLPRRTRASVHGLLALALCVGAARGAPADDDPPPVPGGAAVDPLAASAAFARDVEKASAPFVPKLEALGQWCETSTLLIERARVAEALLLIDPENDRGRAWLRWKRQKDGSWKQTSLKPFFDERPDLLPEWEKRRAEVAGPLRLALELFLERKDEWRTAGVRDRVLRTLVALHPDDAELHDRVGETRVGAKWILKASAETPEGRKRILNLAIDTDLEVLKSARNLIETPSQFPACVGTTEFRVESSLPIADARELAGRIIGARMLYERVLGTRTRLKGGFVVYLFATPDAGHRFLERSEVPEDRKKVLRKLASYWLDDNELVVSDPTRDSRVDGCVRHVIATLTGDAAQLFNGTPGCLSEGIGVYLTHALVGSRLTRFVRETEYSDQSFVRELNDANADWVQIVRKLVLEKAVVPNLPVLTGLPINSMTKDDALMSYALAAYLLEGRPKDLLLLLLDMKDGRGFPRALAECMDIDPEGLEYRFVRWLRETK